MSLEVLYQDPYYVAVHKPAGLLVHRTKIDIQESEAVVQKLRNQIGQKVFPVHRLDRPTSGVLVLAKTSEAAQKLAAEFAMQKIEKKYLALVRGQFKEEIFLDYPLTQEIEEAGQPPKTQEAQTTFKPLASVELNVQVDRYPTTRYSLVEAIPKTGRTHQIRKHLKHLNHPIIGDVNHGNGKHNRYFSQKLKVKGLLLSCVQLSFQHPFLDEKLTLNSSLPKDFKEALAKIGLNYDPAT